MCVLGMEGDGIRVLSLPPALSHSLGGKMRSNQVQV